MSNLYYEAERFRYLILAAQRQGVRMLNDQLKAHDLTASQAEVIRVLEERQPISLKELGSLLVCETGSPSRLIDRMVTDGLIDKMSDPNDSRYVLLRLTPKGTTLAGSVRHIEIGMYEQFRQLYTEEELTATGDAMEKLIRHMPIEQALVKRGLIAD